jgi:hypothetical protein
MRKIKNKELFLRAIFCILFLLPIGEFFSLPLTAQCGTSWALVNYQEVKHVIRDVGYNGSLFAAVGDEGLIWSSSDGINWTRRTATPYQRMHLFCITYGQGKFVAVGLFEYIVTSADGITWTQRRYVNGASALWGVAYGDGVFVAVGDNGMVITSPDGVTWTKRSSGIPGRLMDVVNANGKFVATGTDQKFFVSTDGGISWTAYGSTSANMISITYGNGLFVAGGVSVVYTSPDGMNWTKENPGLNNLFWDVVYSPTAGLYVAVGNRGTHKNAMVATSPDGKSWAWRESNVPSELLGACVGGDRMVAGGVVGAITTNLCTPPAAQVVVAGPNGYEEWDPGSKQIIRWGTFGTVGNVNIEYSTNNGDSWNTIASNTANDGAQDWTVPNTPSTQCQVRISETADGNPTDTSNVNFTITSVSSVTITLISPNGGETLVGGTVHNIRWTGSTKFTGVDIEYYNGSDWVGVVTGTADDGQYEWTVPTGVETRKARMWIKGYSGVGEDADFTDDYYTITQSGAVSSITVTSPNGGETLTGGTIHTITWAGSKTFDSIDIEYHNGSTWVGVVTGTADDGKYDWTVPNISTTRARVWIKGWHADGDAVDTTDNYFTIEKGTPAGTILVTAPNGGEEWLHGTTQDIRWTSTGTVGNVMISYSPDDAKTWTPIISSTPNDGYYSWTLPADLNSNQCRVRITDVSNSLSTDMSDYVFSIGGLPEIALNKTRFNFGSLVGGAVTGAQMLFITNNGGTKLNWTAAADVPWINLNPASGSGDGVVTISVTPNGLSIGNHTGAITISDPDATNSPQTVSVYLTVKPAHQDQPPFGQFATPEDGTAGVTGSIPVTGWALDDIEVASVKIYREVYGELSYIGDAVFVEGARPDVEQVYPDHPYNSRAGWGYMMLTNFLPDGELVLKAIATDTTGYQVTLGTKTIYLDNQNAVEPFGAIDTPAQGGDASGADFRNQGWVLTPQPNKIPEDGSTINVYVDGAFIGKANYNIPIPAIADLFPGYTNSSGPMAYLDFDTTVYTNGVHTIAWDVTDNGGNSDGIGSRYFTIQNAAGVETVKSTGEAKIGASLRDIANIPMDRTPARFRKGYHKNTPGMDICPVEGDSRNVEITEVERIEIRLADPGTPGNRFTGFMVVGDQLHALPIGSTLDAEKGIFYWQPGPGFCGEYELVFIARGQEKTLKKSFLIRILPKFSK